MIGSNIELVKNALDASSLRQEAISSNLANINTEDYKANKVVFERLLQKASNGTAMSKTDDRHFGGNNIKDTLPRIEKKKNTIWMCVSKQTNQRSVVFDYVYVGHLSPFSLFAVTSYLSREV